MAKLARMGAAMKSLAAITLSRTVFSFAELAAMAEAKIQRLPCAFLVLTRSLRISVGFTTVVEDEGG